jgi:hypothetical protein
MARRQRAHGAQRQADASCAMSDFSWRTHGARYLCAVMTGAYSKNDGALACAIIIFPTAPDGAMAHFLRRTGKFLEPVAEVAMAHPWRSKLTAR